MIARLTEEGLKAWPLAGSTRVPTALPLRSGVDLVGLNRRASYAQIWLQQPWIHALSTKLARGVARVPIATYRYTDETREDKERQQGHDIAGLLRRPFPGGSQFRLKEAITGSLTVYGHALCVKFRKRNGEPPSELWPVPWHLVSIYGSDREPIGYYEITAGTERRIFLPEDVVHFMWWGPDGLGVSPLEPLRRTVAMEDAAQRYAISSFSNAARPSGFVRTDLKLNPNDRQELREEINAVHGGPDNAFRIALLTHGLDWRPTSHSAQEAEVIAHRRINREEACAVYDVPPPIVHILDRATFSNIVEQHIMWYADTLGTWFTMESDTFETQLCEREPAWQGYTVAFDLSEILKGDSEKYSQQLQREFQSGAATPNENRAALGRDPIGDIEDESNPANHVYVPVNMVPISGEEEVEEELPIEGEEPIPGLTTNGGGVPPAVAEAVARGVASALTHLSSKRRKRKRVQNGNPVS
jgi:HK97 family phage portal protein